MENKKGNPPGTHGAKRLATTPRQRAAYEADRTPRASPARLAAMRAGKSDHHTLTASERKTRASHEDKQGPAGFHGSKRGKDVLSQRPPFSKPSHHRKDE